MAKTRKPASPPAKEHCGDCRFWLPVPLKGDCVVEGPCFGWYRRYPPKLSDHLASVTIARPGFMQNITHEEATIVDAVWDATLFPSSYRHEWCGEFSAEA